MTNVLTLKQMISIAGLRVIEIARFMNCSRGWVNSILSRATPIDHKTSTLNLINRVRVIATALYIQGVLPLPKNLSPKYRRDELGRYWQFMEDRMDNSNVNETRNTSTSISHTQ